MNVLKIVLIIANINKDENKSLISNQFSLKNDPPPPPHPTHTHFLENYFAEVKIKKLKTITNHFYSAVAAKMYSSTSNDIDVNGRFILGYS